MRKRTIFARKSLKRNSKHYLKHRKNNKGITLVSLVVTIIVLIILATISINALLGENGIIKIAKQAKENIELSQEKEQTELNELYTQVVSEGETSGEISYDAIAKLAEFKKVIAQAITNRGIQTSETDTKEKMAENIGKIGSIEQPSQEKVIVGELVKEKNKPYTKNGTAIIPVGFAIVPGLDDVEQGLVISDVVNDTENTGNQFVWIPVNKETFDTKFKRTEGYYNSNLQSLLKNCEEADATGVNDKVTEDSSVTTESIAMYSSVKTNGGFYIGRYESGTTANLESGSGIRGDVVVKKGANVYNNIGWSNLDDMTNVTGGAVQVARGMYTTSNKDYGAVSTLCYGVQWDAALNFIDPDYITNEVDGKPNCQSNSYLVNSAGKGWYVQNYKTKNPNHITGVDVDDEASNKVKNIYDMAGNVREWTMESEHTGHRVFRGRIL